MSDRNQPEGDPLGPVVQAISHELAEIVGRALTPLIERIEELERQVSELQGEQGKNKTAGSKPINRRHR